MPSQPLQLYQGNAILAGHHVKPQGTLSETKTDTWTLSKTKMDTWTLPVRNVYESDTPLVTGY